MILLSYTTIDNYLKCHHSWLCKQLDIKIEETDAMKQGKINHKIIQAHLLGEKMDDRLSSLTWKFQKAEYHARMNWDEEYNLHGYADCVDFKSKTLCEIKTGSPWSMQKFNDLMQWKYYAMVTGFRRVLFINCDNQLGNVRTFLMEATDKDMENAKQWVSRAVQGLKQGLLKDDLVNGKCTDPYKCPYGRQCYFA